MVRCGRAWRRRLGSERGSATTARMSGGRVAGQEARDGSRWFPSSKLLNKELGLDSVAATTILQWRSWSILEASN
uniref:Uncharacterized protein n=1 Tax=Arundo donax TaxID=35708 RepID=A0A0A8Z3B8_ARUDO